MTGRQALSRTILNGRRKRERNNDIALAIGVMDCVDDAWVYLASFRHIAREVIVTFPIKSMFSFITDFTYRQQGMRDTSIRRSRSGIFLGAAKLRSSVFTRFSQARIGSMPAA